MKIERFTKNKNGMYQLTLENQMKVKVHEDLILKYELLLSKELDENTLLQIRDENLIYEIYEIALKYLKSHLRSKLELSCYLSKKGYSEEVIQSVSQMLQKHGYLDDKAYAISYVHDKISMSHDGPRKIDNDLRKIGISEEAIQNALVCFTEEIEREKIEKLIKKQIKINHNKGSMLLKRKIEAYLLQLGYSSSLIHQCLNGKKLVDSDLYQKEYQKLYQKLCKKYSGKELEYQLKQKMYYKGFSNNDIE